MKGLRLSHEHNARVAARLVEIASFAIALAIEPVACHAAILQATKCCGVLAVKY